MSDERRQKKVVEHNEWLETLQQLPWRGDISMEELKKHNTRDDLWMVYDGYVYDVTQYAAHHPGGAHCFVAKYSHDLTHQYKSVHPHIDIKIVEKLKIGKLIQ